MELRINGQDKLLTDVAANAAAIATNTTNIGDLAYTENNYITDSEPLTESVDKLDMAVNDNAAQISQLADDHKLKVASIEKELNDYQRTMAAVNVNQEAKQTASGYGAVSLPKNAASGNMGVKVEGLTATNLVTNGNFANETTGWNKGSGLISATNGVLSHTANDATAYSYCYSSTTTTCVAGHKIYVTAILAVTNEVALDLYLQISGSTSGSALNSATQTSPVKDTPYTLSGISTLTNQVGNIVVKLMHHYDSTTIANGKILKGQYVCVVDLTATFGAGNEPTVEQCDAMFANWFDGTKSTLSAMRIRSVSSDETQSSALYIPDVGVLRSLEAVADELTATEHIKRIDDDGTALATPIITPIQSSGTLVSFPSGTVYVEKAIADAGIYDSGITVLNTDKPISTLESLSKIDFATGQPTPFDASTAVIAGDGLRFTHPDLTAGDIVFFTYFYDKESTEGETTLEYYDSRYVIKNEDDGKFYQWAIKASGTPPTATIELEEV